MALVVTKFPRRGEVFLIDLDPTRGTEIQKTRPCVVVSPDDLNAHLRTVIIAPMTTAMGIAGILCLLSNRLLVRDG